RPVMVGSTSPNDPMQTSHTPTRMEEMEGQTPSQYLDWASANVPVAAEER
ncbi:4897_t:CDS:1, partial [Ambispora gerdemannii]